MDSFELSLELTFHPQSCHHFPQSRLQFMTIFEHLTICCRPSIPLAGVLQQSPSQPLNANSSFMSYKNYLLQILHLHCHSSVPCCLSISLNVGLWPKSKLHWFKGPLNCDSLPPIQTSPNVPCSPVKSKLSFLSPSMPCSIPFLLLCLHSYLSWNIFSGYLSVVEPIYPFTS